MLPDERPLLAAALTASAATELDALAADADRAAAGAEGDDDEGREADVGDNGEVAVMDALEAGRPTVALGVSADEDVELETARQVRGSAADPGEAGGEMGRATGAQRRAGRLDDDAGRVDGDARGVLDRDSDRGADGNIDGPREARRVDRAREGFELRGAASDGEHDDAGRTGPAGQDAPQSRPCCQCGSGRPCTGWCRLSRAVAPVRRR